MKTISLALDIPGTLTIPDRPNEGSVLFEANEGSVRVGNFFEAWEFRPNIGQYGYRSTDPWVIDYDLIVGLDTMRKLLGRSISVQSGYRPAYYNSQLAGSASDSQHIRGKAADISTSGVEYATLAGLALLVGFRGIGVYSSHLHVDTRDGDIAMWGIDSEALGNRAETAFKTWILPALL